ncbi:DUF6973 domain-containing protein [Erysipelothrix aquatica]|uniref:DUF6973 domain-containing protein n=1 Tax=Erysipelothrix aquatica TaxID=2683714 RepID=UPI001358CD38|nr:hypothetical protein [Erysipelothrix aquatica]
MNKLFKMFSVSVLSVLMLLVMVVPASAEEDVVSTWYDVDIIGVKRDSILEETPNLSEEDINSILIDYIFSDEFKHDKENRVQARNLYDQYSSLTSAEKDLVKRYPFQAVTVRKIAQDADRATVEYYANAPSHEFHNGNADAYRHCVWNMFMTIHLSRSEAEMWATAHEQNPNQPQIEKEMDLMNNSVGRSQAPSGGSDVFYRAKERSKELARNGSLTRISNGVLVRTNS